MKTIDCPPDHTIHYTTEIIDGDRHVTTEIRRPDGSVFRELTEIRPLPREDDA